MGLQAAFTQVSIQSDQLIFAENINPDDGSIAGSSTDVPDQSSATYLDFAGGILAYTNSFYAGVSAKHITQPDESLYENGAAPLPVRIAGNLGVEIKSPSSSHDKSPFYFSPNILFVQQGKFMQLTGGALMGVGVIYGGLAYRYVSSNSDALIPIVGVRMGVFKMGYSYDVTISDLKGKTGGSHEVTIVLNFHDTKNGSRLDSRRFTECPMFLK